MKKKEKTYTLTEKQLDEYSANLRIACRIDLLEELNNALINDLDNGYTWINLTTLIKGFKRDINTLRSLKK